MPKRKRDLPSTLQRSDEHAQEIFIKTHDSAVETYGEGERAHRTAFAALKHSYKKEGDRWVSKGSKGPSDPQAALGQGERERSGGQRPRKTAGGAEVPMEEWSKEDLYAYADKRDISGRSRMSKAELIEAIKKSQS
jgi:cation transport regulator ChaB